MRAWWAAVGRILCTHVALLLDGACCNSLDRLWRATALLPAVEAACQSPQGHGCMWLLPLVALGKGEGP